MSDELDFILDSIDVAISDLKDMITDLEEEVKRCAKGENSEDEIEG